MSGGKKNKNHRVGSSVGLIAVPLQFGLYVFGQLSKWFTFSVVCQLIVWCVVPVFTLTGNGSPSKNSVIFAKYIKKRHH